LTYEPPPKIDYHEAIGILKIFITNFVIISFPGRYPSGEVVLGQGTYALVNFRSFLTATTSHQAIPPKKYQPKIDLPIYNVATPWLWWVGGEAEYRCKGKPQQQAKWRTGQLPLVPSLLLR
jgi:hypothetical protein